MFETHKKSKTLTEDGSDYLSVKDKWQPILEDENAPKIKNRYVKDTVVRLLENQHESMKKNSQDIYEAAPANQTGANIDNYDPILISLVRRVVPSLIAFDIIGVQPMSGPTGLIFAIKSHYDSQTGVEAGGQNEYETDHSGQNSGDGLSSPTHVPTDDTNNPFEGVWTTGTHMTTAEAEALGDAGGNHFNEMAFSIEKTTVTAGVRALKAEYTIELAQDLKAIHGLDAEAELSNMLYSEIMGEINREVIRTLLKTAKLGAQKNTATPGIFDADADSNGRWMLEKYKGMLMAIERDSNAVAKETRRGKGNWIICSSDVASALSMAGKLETNPINTGGWNVDDMGQTFVGRLNGRYNVYIDPYWVVSDMEFYMVGYKGPNPWDSGMFYCPYVPLQLVRAQGENTFQPKIGFKTRYGIVSNPFVGNMNANANPYYRKVRVNNLM